MNQRKWKPGVGNCLIGDADPSLQGEDGFWKGGCMNDDGFTFLPGGLRVRKSDELICAIGSLDELNAALGLLRVQLSKQADADLIRSIQGDLFQMGNELATDHPQLEPQRVGVIEQETEKRNHSLPPLEGFILPGGSLECALTNWVRTVCRRTERDLVRAQETNPSRVTALALQYLNRLSGLLFALAREGKP